MTPRPSLLATALVALAMTLAGCNETSSVTSAAAPASDEPAVVEPIEGSDVARVILSETAVRYLKIETAPVAYGPSPSPSRATVVVPYSTLIYDADGAAWVYTSPKPRTYLRAPVTIRSIDGDVVTLSRGPAVGTVVVTVGAAELVGAEAGIDGEE